MAESELQESDLQGASALLEEQGLAPHEWTITGWRTWGPSEGDKQVYLSVIPRKPEGLILPARTKGDLIRPHRPVKRFKTKPRLVAFISDQHAPHHDERLHEITCRWLEEYKPSEVIVGGDLMELASISRHRKAPEHQEVQNCIDTGTAILKDYITANPKANYKLLPGNHDDRLQHIVIDQARELYGLRRGLLPGEDNLPEALSLSSLLRCDEMGIEVIPGSYEAAQVAITPYLAARHGYKALKGAGKSALSHMNDLGHGLVHGHTHRQAIVYKTTFDVAGKPSTQAAIEAGCMCRLELAETYSSNPDWQQGFAAFTVFPDGTYHAELVNYVKNSLFWRGERFR